MTQPSEITYRNGTFADALQAHQNWLNGNGGERLSTPWRFNLSGADLSGADLSDADLRGADLSDADLRGADLRDADLRGANLRDADLSGADLRDADLRGANLRDADLSDADLRGADLRDADLRGANLRDADLRDADLRGADLRDTYLSGADLRGVIANYTTVGYYMACPESGAFDGWKKCYGGVIVRIRIPARAKRSSATTRKCRAEYVKVLEVIGADEAVANYNRKTVYRVGETVRCHEWNDDRWNECSGGIHFFITRAEAEAWT